MPPTADSFEISPEPDEELTGPKDIAALIARLKKKYHSQITAEVIMPAAQGAYADFPADLHPGLAAALRGRGIRQLYSHQRQAWETVQSKRHLVVVTPRHRAKPSATTCRYCRRPWPRAPRRCISSRPRPCPRTRWQRSWN